MGKSCCFIGHRKIEYTKELENQLYDIVENLILNQETDTFYFGSKSEFNSLCVKIVGKLKGKYPNINRIYIRAEYPNINDSYKAYLLESYDETFFPEKIFKAGKASYVQRNRELIDKSNFCIFYYKEDYIPPMQKNSGTKIAYNYAKKKNKIIICL